MKKFIKGMLISAGVFFAVGIVLMIVGVTVSAATGQSLIARDGDMAVVRDVWDHIRWGNLRWGRGGERGLILDYGDIEFDGAHDVAYGSFTDDTLSGDKIRNLDLEIGAGKLTVCQGDALKLKKEGGPECQYYIEGDTFYLKQRSPVGGRAAELTLTLPKDLLFEEVEIAMNAGEILTEDLLAAGRMEIEIDAGELTMEEVRADSFKASVDAGGVTVNRLDAMECDVEVNLGSITLREGLVSGDLDATVNMGDITILLRDSYEDHDYEVECSMGSVEIRREDGTTREYSGFSSDMEFSGARADGGSRYNLNCDMGNILLGFGGAEYATKETVRAAGVYELPPVPEVPETPEAPEVPPAPEVPEAPSLPELSELIVDNWPESIGRENEGTSASKFIFDLPVSEPMTVILSCVTAGGELDMEIEDEKGREVFEEDDIPTGDYEVKFDRAGTYHVTVKMKEHRGSFWITPKK